MGLFEAVPQRGTLKNSKPETGLEGNAYLFRHDKAAHRLPYAHRTLPAGYTGL